MVDKINPVGNVYPLKPRKKRPTKDEFLKPRPPDNAS